MDNENNIFRLSQKPSPIWVAKQHLDQAITEISKGNFHGFDEKKPVSHHFFRIEVPVNTRCHIFSWLRAQRSKPRLYFRTLDRLDEIGGIGASHCLTGQGEVSLADVQVADLPNWVRYIGGQRFDLDTASSEAWEDFEGHYFVLPFVEFSFHHGAEESGMESTMKTLAVNLHWESGLKDAFQDSAKAALEYLRDAGNVLDRPVLRLPTAVSTKASMDFPTWQAAVETVLSNIDKGAYRKVVLARFCDFEFLTEVNPLDLMIQFESQHGYLFCMELNSGKAFVGCTPEQLFKVKGNTITADSIAGTRPRGCNPEEDEKLEQELFASQKDQTENSVTAQHITEVLTALASDVTSHPPYIMKLAHVQHIAKKIQAHIDCSKEADDGNSISTAFSLLEKLNPTPAVCGHPQKEAYQAIRDLEGMDRGFYAGPIGILSSTCCEFGVALRSALLFDNKVRVFAGGGLVPGSEPMDEWNEHRVKMKNFSSLFAPSLPDLISLPNINTLWATLIVEELYRLGVTHYCVCPGSRSTPLTTAVARHNEVTSIVCHDERGAAFYAVGYAQATQKPCPIIVTSGTAVANLLPGVVEASMEFLPMLLLTADRPPELRDTGANQTISQPTIFNGYCRFMKDFPCPDDRIPATSLLSDIDYAFSKACNPQQPGPVHLNFMFRENLAPDGGLVRENALLSSEWSVKCLESPNFTRWEINARPFTQNMCAPHSSTYSGEIFTILKLVESAKRGILIVGTLNSEPERESVASFADLIQWPVFADITSGIRRVPGIPSVAMYDQLLTDDLLQKGLKPDMILHIGGRIISKRLQHFIQASDPEIYALISPHASRNDPGHILSHQIAFDIASLSRISLQELSPKTLEPSELLGLCHLSEVSEDALHKYFELPETELSEPEVAFILSQMVGNQEGVFISNSMPVRDQDMFVTREGNSLLVNVGTNRGASGIDGIISSAIGFAKGLELPVTLVIGDMSFIHDMNALHLLRLSNEPITIAVVNNSGSGIFSFLPIAKHVDVFKGFFDTEHPVQFKEVCQGFGVNYSNAHTALELQEKYFAAQDTRVHNVIEIFVNRETNLQIHREISSTLKESVREKLAGSISLPWSQYGDRSKFPLLFLHGFMGCKSDWKKVVMQLKEHYFCITLDLPGHGTSCISQLGPLGVLQYSMAIAGIAIKRLLSNLGIKKCGLVGYSMGGRLSMFLSKTYPDLFPLSVIISASPGLRSILEKQRRWKTDQITSRSFTRMKTKREFEDFLNTKWYRSPIWGPNFRDSEVYALSCGKKIKNNPQSMAKSVLGMSVSHQESMWDWLLSSERNQKVLFIAGNLDPSYSKTAKEIEAKADPNVTTIRYCNSGHACLVESPADCANFVAEFLDNQQLEAENTRTTKNDVFHELVIEDVTMKPINLQLTRPLPLKHGTIESRHGVVICLKSRCGSIGIGEVMPLPGFHKEDLQDCMQQLQPCLTSLKGRSVPETILALDGSFAKWLNAERLSPLVKAGIEMAVLHLLSGYRNESMVSLLAESRGLGSHSHIQLNGLATYEMDIDTVPSQYHVLKVKVGAKPVEEEIIKLNSLIQKISENSCGVRLRLDANQAWTMEEACQFAAGLSSFDCIEYIEEPLNNPLDLQLFFDKTGMPYALDESLSDGKISIENISVMKGLEAVVLKPAMSGGFEKCLAVLDACNREGNFPIQGVISCAFESSISLCHMALFASVFCEDSICHGLGTYDRLETDVIDKEKGFGAAIERNGTVNISKCLSILKGISKSFK